MFCVVFEGYLKLYQLQNPQITEYDCILVDEAQDLTPGAHPSFPSLHSCPLPLSLSLLVISSLFQQPFPLSPSPPCTAIISIIKAQNCAKVLAGDPHQQIYGFKGATDAMALIHADHTFHLTRVSCNASLLTR